MDVIVNIGLARSGQSNIAIGTVLREVASHGFEVVEHITLESDTEPTVVARLRTVQSWATVQRRVHFLSILLGQDCIAVYELSLSKGALCGPRAAEWGPFNPDFFLLFDNSRLSQHAQAFAA